MEVKTLGELCNIVSGGTPSRSKAEFWNAGTIPWIKIGNIRGKYVDEADEYITQAGLESSSTKLLSKGTVLYTIFATLGEVGVLSIDACTNQAIAGLTIKDNNKLDTDYLYYYLKSKKSYVNNVGRGVAQNNINMSILRNFELALPNFRVQKEIVSILDKVSKVNDCYEKELQKLDELIKSRFVEMFGDMILNPNGWERVMLGMVCDVRDGTHDSPKYYMEGYPLVTSKNVTGGRIDFTDCSLICEEDYNKINQRSKVDVGDILMPMIGTVGNPVIVDIDAEFAIKNVALIKFREDAKVVNIFVKALLKSDYFDATVLSKVRGGTQKFISLGDIRKLELFLPPIGLQNQFADFVNQVEKSKVAVQKSLDETQLLFDSLMQKYFG